MYMTDLTSDLCLLSLDECVRQLSKEVRIDFARSMNRIVFDKIVDTSPVMFPYIKVQRMEEPETPDTGNY